MRFYRLHGYSETAPKELHLGLVDNIHHIVECIYCYIDSNNFEDEIDVVSYESSTAIEGYSVFFDDEGIELRRLVHGVIECQHTTQWKDITDSYDVSDKFAGFLQRVNQ